MNDILSIEEQFIKKLTEIINANFRNEQFTVADLSKEMGISRATLHRKLKTITNKTVSQFINETRLVEAEKLLKNRIGSVAEIAHLVGFGSTTYFIKCFHERFGFPPGTILKENHPKNGNNKNQLKQKSRVSPKAFSAISLMVIILIIIGWSFGKSSKQPMAEPKILTENMAALNAYNQGLHLMEVYEGSIKEEHFLEAKLKFEYAIKLDSTFGDAYARIANIYISHMPFSPKTNKGRAAIYADSSRFLLDKAAEFGVSDPDFLLRLNSTYFHRRGKFPEALELFEQLWENKEKDYTYFHARGNHGFHAREYNVAIENLIHYLEIKPDSVLPIHDRLLKLSILFSFAGFQNEAQEFAFRQFELTQDSIRYWNHYPTITYECGNFDEAIKTYEKAYGYNNVSWTVYTKLLEIYLLTGKHNEALKLFPKFLAFCNNKYDKPIPNYLLGYYHYLNGEKELARWHFKEVIRKLEHYCAVNPFQQRLPSYLTIAACYAMIGDKDGLLRSLNALKQKTSTRYITIVKLQKSPLFDNFRNDPDFIKAKLELEEKYFNERKEIEKILAGSNLKYTYTNGESLIPSPHSAN